MKGIKSFFLLVIAVVFCYVLQAQILKILPGTDLTIKEGTIFFTDSLLLTPSSDFTINDMTLTRSTTVGHPTSNPYIARVYQFSIPSYPYNGSVQIIYADGSELNGIAEVALTLNIHDGISWNAYSPTTRDFINNIVITAGLGPVSLSEVTLADALLPLPLLWKSFTAIQENSNVVLQWATWQELNTRDFTIQHATNNMNWKTLATLPATGNNNSTSNYTYLHTSPETGNNYYRLIQTDKDGRSSYSETRRVDFRSPETPFVVSNNPVTGGILSVRVNTSTWLSLYSTDGKLYWTKQVNAGTHSIDISRHAKGIYILKTNTNTQIIIIQ